MQVQSSVLVVEDDPVIREIICETLADAHFKVVEASSTEGAIAILDGSTPFAAAFVDVDLGDRAGGFEVARRARAVQPSIEIIYTSGGAQETFPTERVPGAVFVQKPYTPSRVCLLISDLIEAHAA